MNILIIGTEVVSKIIGEAILNEVDSITYVDDSSIAYKNWNFSNPKVKFFGGDINRMDTLLEAGLDNADLVIASTSNDATNAFLAQKAKINFELISYMILQDPALLDVYKSLGFHVIDFHKVDPQKINQEIQKIQ
tara:strand:- start:727 stop:1131 length:405 start_codon:yes stop_codon:yes gene_type:complete